MSASTGGSPPGSAPRGTTWSGYRPKAASPIWPSRRGRNARIALLLTQDTAFGAIALKHGSPRTGVVIVRASVRDIERVARRLARLIERASGDLAAAITVLDDRGVRSRPIG